MREPDLWWQLRSGQWMVENFAVTRSDLFSFTQEGVEWINVKWFFEVLQYFFASLGGPELLLLMQTFANILLLWMLYKLAQTVYSLQLVKKFQVGIAFIISVLSFLFAMDYRMAGRPEMVSHVLSLAFLLLLLNHRREKSKGIFWLIPLQLFWANSHEAYGTGLVILVVAIAAHLFESRIRKWEPLDKNFMLSSLLAIASTGINPRGLYLFIHPFNIFNQVGDNKFTTELYNIQTNYFWQQTEAWLAIGVLFICLIGFFLFRKKLGSPGILKQFGLAYFVLFVLFIYLGSTAHRNLTFFFIWAFPLLLLTIESIGQWKLKNIKLFGARPWVFPIFALLLSVFCLGYVLSGKYFERFNNRERLGLKISLMFNPVGAANFLKEKNAAGATIFSDYLASAYLMWELRPEFKSFIDLRDLDIYPASFFKAFEQLSVEPAGFDKFDEEYHFDYVVLKRLYMPNLHRYISNKADWQLVYGDAITVVYQRTDAAVLEIPFRRVEQPESSTLASLLNFPISPFIPEETIPSPYLTAAEYYLTVGRFELAWTASQKALEEDALNDKHCRMALQILVQKAASSQTQEELRSYFDIGQNILNQKTPKDWNAFDYLEHGRLFMSMGDAINAMVQFRKSAKLSEGKDIYSLMAQCQNLLMQVDPNNQTLYAKKWYEYMLKAYSFAPDDPTLNFNLGVSYCQSARCQQAEPFLKKASFQTSFSDQELKALAECKKICRVSN